MGEVAKCENMLDLNKIREHFVYIAEIWQLLKAARSGTSVTVNHDLKALVNKFSLKCAPVKYDKRCSVVQNPPSLLTHGSPGGENLKKRRRKRVLYSHRVYVKEEWISAPQGCLITVFYSPLLSDLKNVFPFSGCFPYSNAFVPLPASLSYHTSFFFPNFDSASTKWHEKSLANKFRVRRKLNFIG